MGVEPKSMLDEKVLEKYSRQIVMIGEEGQEKLFKSSVLIAGAGALGSVTATYLACAGIGRIGIVDGDVVEVHNLHRQFMHAQKVGMNKAESAGEYVEKLNPDVEVEVYPYFIDEKNAKRLVERYDVIVTGIDNFEARLILNDLCVSMGKPMIHGAVFQYEGEVTTVVGSPCYRCLYLTYPKQEAEPIMPIIGFTCGVTGSIQSAEVIKAILGLELLTGKLMRFDLRNMEFLKIEYEPHPECPNCSEISQTSDQL
jgi:adenylyltransferase/sulfurtransferase